MSARRLLPAVRTTAGIGAGIVLTGCAVGGAAEGSAAATSVTLPAGPTSDGTYSGSGSYETPGGPQRIDVTVVLSDGIVQTLRVDPAASNATSRRFQERFASVVVETVVGRPVAEVAVDRIAGSSSTGAGFMAALGQVVRDAARA